MCDSNIAVKDCFKVAKEASPSWNSFQAVSALFYKAAVQEAPSVHTSENPLGTGAAQGCSFLAVRAALSPRPSVYLL